jgi:hypothetical protein
MQNAMNQDKAEKQWNNVKGQVDRAVSEVKKIDTDDLRNTAAELTSKVRDLSTNVYNDSVGFVKRYPISSALGLAAIGYLFGVLSARKK